jgi:acetoin utilization deacetylase AcuC-like enzyme
MTLIFAHPAFGRHEVPPGHVERPGRYDAVTKGLDTDDLRDVERRESPRGEWTPIERAHLASYVADIRAAAPVEGLRQLDPDTFMGPHTLDAALRGAGGAVAAVDAVFRGEASNAFVAARPPGHHSVPDRAMGFCLFNNAAIAAYHAREEHGATRIAVVDFDVHHGNGTQDILERDENAFFASSHEWPQYPGTGRESERGVAGNCHNAPLDSGTRGTVFRRVWENRLLPALQEFRPDFIVVSAGFDAHRDDPLGGLELEEDDYAWVTNAILDVADDTAEGRVVSVLEGGYDLGALERSVREHVIVLAGRDSRR